MEAPAVTEPVPSVMVFDQYDTPVTVRGSYRGHQALVIEVDIAKPALPLQPHDACTVLTAALLGMNLARDVRSVGADVNKELQRMDYALISTREEP